MNFEVNTQDKKTVLKIFGTISGTNSMKLSKTLVVLAKGESTEIILDLSATEYIDSPGLGGIIYAQILCQKNNKKIVLASPKNYLDKLFRDCLLDKKFEIVTSYEQPS